MKAIVGIGGGELGLGETRPLDEYIVSLCKKEHPKALFLPTATHDSESYIAVFNDMYRSLGCDTSALRLWSFAGTAADVRELILYSDIVYIGGGCMEAMLQIWEKYKVQDALAEAYERGIICCGLSAGCICWTDHSYCDYDDGHGFFSAQCMGILPIIIGPHYSQQDWKGFDDFMKGQTLPGLAIDTNTALSVIDGEYRIIHGQEDKAAWLLADCGGTVVKVPYEGGDPQELMAQMLA
ncbi:MAG: Type 1 glutamine amidotransferase-like domain-containing protein [Oscillospiraceae bacterium]|nr:Type 1 glutamine amidotransferase-like domain-containing protein [Oscillospiraceae bacterium]